jgi:DNA-directed RNA polymerase subunit omega
LEASPEVPNMSNDNPLHNKYSLVKGAARRARQLQSGAQPLMPTKSMKACRVAQDEINQGRVTYVVTHEPKDAEPLGDV